MSSYLQHTKNPKTGKFEPAVWLDDKYGNHNYGVRFLDGEWYDPRTTKLETRGGLVNAAWDDFFPQPKHQKQGNDLAAPDRIPELPADSINEPTSARPSPSKGLVKATTDAANPPKSATIEDKLDNLQMPGFGVGDCYVIGKQTLKDFITTETTNARIDELNKLWSDDQIYWVESGSSEDWEKSITIADRIATLQGGSESLLISSYQPLKP